MGEIEMQSRKPPRAMLRRFSAFNIFIYRISGGRFMGRRNDLPLLLLSTTGRSSGALHTVPLVYLRDGERYIVMPGVYERPDWYLNLKANPGVQIQVGSVQFAVVGEEVTGSERERLWRQVPQYWRDYQEQYSQRLPVMVLQPS